MNRKGSAHGVNYLNIALMLVSAAAAFRMPFELFLFAYACLGPLHYLTEISWLHDRRYFTRGNHDYLFLVLMSVVICAAGLGTLPALPDWLNTALTFLAFGAALVFVLTGDGLARVFWIAILIALSGWVGQSVFFRSTFNILLPTIIHVFLFTGMFVLVGALKGKSRSGFASLAVFCLCALGFFVLSPDYSAYRVGEGVRKIYQEFSLLNYTLMAPFRAHDLQLPANLQQYTHYVNAVLYRSPAALAVMGFIAFAYTYHYLNWFSKTSIIQWHHIPRARFLAVLLLWLASVGVYVADYTAGLKWLFFLSFTHVLLEFPLNHLTFINIGKELKAMAAGRKAVGLTAARRGEQTAV